MTKANINYPGLVLSEIGGAYRHALWNALCTFDLGLELTESLTTAHEDQPSTHPYDYKENEMDLFHYLEHLQQV